MSRAIEQARDTYELSNDQRKVPRFERPAEQTLATEPQVKQEVRSILCHTCQ